MSLYDPPASGPQPPEESQPAANPFGPVESLLRERFDITEPDGMKLVGRMYGTRHRHTGRRITVHDQAGKLLFDSDDCYDAGNATNSLDWFLNSRIKAARVREQGENVLALAAVRQSNPHDSTDALCVG